KDYEETPGLNHFGFRVDDVEKTKAELEAKGIKFVSDVITSKSSGRKVCNFRDPSYMRHQITTH
ncbi:partial methylmalonyl-CoA/ethylmalonyl-CoA epimerase, partial [Anaerolineae bacterium]